MSQSLNIAKELLLIPSSLDESIIDKLIRSMMKPQIDDAELYFQTCSYESWYLEDSEVKSGSFSIDRGVGIRAISGDKTGYAYCDDILLPAIERAASAAQSIAVSGSPLKQSIQIPSAPVSRYQAVNPIEGMTKQEKIALLEMIDKEARSIDPRVKQVNAALSGSYEVVMVAGMHGQLIADVRPLVSIQVSVIVEDKNGRRETARSGGGGRVAYSYFTEQNNALHYAREAVREALVNLEAEDAPAGTMPVVLGPGWPGVLLHEAVGHGLEGDFNRKGLSAFSGRIGQQVAASGVTVVDDGTLKDRRGSLTVDDEGTPSQCTTLIENGVLVNYMQDKLNAKLMGMKPTGNCRRESYAHVPMPRMTNTYMLAGSYEPDEIIRSVKRGLYAVNFGGGQVDITSGQFVFSASEAYLIEDGKITTPVKGATLIGSGPEVMKKISMIGNDLSLDSGIGVCGKDGQSVPVGVGQPTLKIDALTIGGTR
ncbi:metalloprotease TldD [Legionella israelensis]|uniref:TldD protein n=1 Tax=Legionella israelensis TaxID=454 RepID=A0A0W0V7D8_9GAMM|nr:metalloprotease TldD [Legionella israelensis]KTD16014.1 TldD protein [Legionella israelensis]QBS08815.1 metalloprotease TldD [Legionella israelensis]SCY05687.1 TldD protein [Legionella israelensis DSM 19235]STX58496.1 TldD protein [Legionella israelensis]